MLLGYVILPQSHDEHLQELQKLLQDSETLVFIDTNIIAYPYRLFQNARRELFAWFADLGERLCVPAWAASEYFARASADRLNEYGPSQQAVVRARNALREVVDMAHLLVDDAPMRRGTGQIKRDEFLQSFGTRAREVIETLDELARLRADTRAIHEEIVSCLRPRIADSSDIAHLCVEASETASYRFAHRMPPGYRDGAKPENANGDLILWFEVMSIARSRTGFSNFVLISNDEKRDWVYRPHQRKRGENGVENNEDPEIRITDPRLENEFRGTVRMSAKFSVVGLSTVVEALSRDNASSFVNLAGAMQLEIRARAGGPAEPSEATQADGQTMAARTPPLSGATDRITDIDVARYGPDAVADSCYRPSDAVLDSIISALREHNWYVQNPAIERLRSVSNWLEFPDARPDTLFVLGRNIYQAACGSAFSAMGYLKEAKENLAEIGDAEANDIAAGIAFEVFFDDQGDVRKAFKVDRIEEVARLLEYERFLPARAYLESRLSETGRLVAMLGTKVVFDVVILWKEVGKKCKIVDMMIDGHSLLQPGTPSWHLQGYVSLADLRRAFAEEYGLAPSSLSFLPCSELASGDEPEEFVLPEEMTLKSGAEVRVGLRARGGHDSSS